MVCRAPYGMVHIGFRADDGGELYVSAMVDRQTQPTLSLPRQAMVLNGWANANNCRHLASGDRLLLQLLYKEAAWGDWGRVGATLELPRHNRRHSVDIVDATQRIVLDSVRHPDLIPSMTLRQAPRRIVS